MKKSTLLIMLTAIILAVAFFGKYVDGKINSSATTILNDRLVPVPLLSHRFDYYGSTIDNSLSIAESNIDTFLSKKGELLGIRKETQKMWDEYKATYLAPDEDSVVKIADVKMIELDKKMDNLFLLADTDKSKADSLLKLGTLRDDSRSIADDVNFLLDLQLRIGKEETLKMLNIVKIFGNFMTGAIALALMLLGSIVYSSYRERKENSQPVEKETKKSSNKKTATKKPAVKKPATKKPAVKKPVKKK
jgi:hypothetical protein